MAKLSLFLAISTLAIALSPKAFSEAKVTKIRFFVQDHVSGRNQTVYQVAQSDITSTSRTSFGALNVVDDPFTVGPKPESKVLGRAQGIIGFADLNEIGFHMSITFLFTSGKYKGSTIAMLGRNHLLEKFRRIPIVGGTGAFELARGIATTSTYSFDPTTHNAILEYSLVVTHD